MLNVSYLRKYGYVQVKGIDGKLYKCDIHPANCLYATVYHDRKRKVAQILDFFSDEKHLERCLKNKLFEEYKKIVIFINTDFKEKFKVARLFAKYNYPVEMKACKRWKKKPR